MFKIGDIVMFSPAGVEHFVRDCGWDFDDYIFSETYQIISNLDDEDDSYIQDMYDWKMVQQTDTQFPNFFWVANEHIQHVTGQIPLPFKGGF